MPERRFEFQLPSGIGRSWIEIDPEQIKRNYLLYKRHLGEDFEVIAVVKANAYGHGDVCVARVLETVGVTRFAVSNIDEAISLRMAGVSGDIIVLGYTPPCRAEDIWRYGITQTLISAEYAEALGQYTDKRLKSQFAIDTGMNRIGIDGRCPEECSRIIRRYLKRFELSGIFTHLCVADSGSDADRAFTDQQIRRFAAVAEAVADLGLPLVHCLNSAGGMYHRSLPDYISKTVRLGIVLYGLRPALENALPGGIAPALSWKTAVTMVKDVPRGETVGYGRGYVAARNIRLATLSTGYADGYRRALSEGGYVLINGGRAPIAGRVCMDQMTVDVSEIPGVRMGDVAVLIGSSGEHTITADDMGRMAGTIGYEVVCGITERVDRVYKCGGSAPRI